VQRKLAIREWKGSEKAATPHTDEVGLLLHSVRVLRQSLFWLQVFLCGAEAPSTPTSNLQGIPFTPMSGRFAGVLRERKPLGAS